MLFDVAFLLISILIMGASYYYLFGRKKQLQKEQNQEQPQQQQQQPQQQERQVRRHVQIDSSDDEPTTEANTNNLDKQAQKEAKRQQKKGQQEYMRQQMDLREKKQSTKNKVYEDREILREEEEKKSEEWKLKIEEDEKKKAQQDYDQWKDMFKVDSKGTQKLNEDEELIRLRDMITRFCNYIKLRKVVQLEDLSSEFKMTTREVIERIKSLELNQQLNGIIDERGKYIYLTEQELQSVKNLIEAKGRISRAELLRECNSLIKLDPSMKDQQQIVEEEKKLLQEVQNEMASIVE